VRWSLTIPGRPDQAATARRFVASALGERHPRAETAVLLVSELVTNSLRHSNSALDGGTITIAVTAAPREHVRVEVTDDGAATLPGVCPASQDAEDGRGLYLVSAEAAAWSCSRQGNRTTTWFELGAESRQASLVLFKASQAARGSAARKPVTSLH
jgi:serine/threonine-protein kinase RsbW